MLLMLFKAIDKHDRVTSQLFDMPVPVRATVRKDGAVVPAHTRIVKVKAKEVPRPKPAPVADLFGDQPVMLGAPVPKNIHPLQEKTDVKRLSDDRTKDQGLVHQKQPVIRQSAEERTVDGNVHAAWGAMSDAARAHLEATADRNQWPAEFTRKLTEAIEGLQPSVREWISTELEKAATGKMDSRFRVVYRESFDEIPDAFRSAFESAAAITVNHMRIEFVGDRMPDVNTLTHELVHLGWYGLNPGHDQSPAVREAIDAATAIGEKLIDVATSRRFNTKDYAGDDKQGSSFAWIDARSIRRRLRTAKKNNYTGYQLGQGLELSLMIPQDYAALAREAGVTFPPGSEQYAEICVGLGLAKKLGVTLPDEYSTEEPVAYRAGTDPAYAERLFATAGPKEGDTKTINGIEYRLQDGRWHRVTQEENSAKPSATFTPTHELSDGTPVVAHPDEPGIWIDAEGNENEPTDDVLPIFATDQTTSRQGVEPDGQQAQAIGNRPVDQPPVESKDETVRAATASPSRVAAFGAPAGATKARRRAINEQCRELLKKPWTDLTDEDKAVLRQYSGNGGCGDSLNEFYTLPEVAASMWQTAARLGLPDGGRVLEPSCGTGVFLHTAPEGARVHGVELDQTSASIAQILHPNSIVNNTALEHWATAATDQYDAVIGNVPFGLRGALIKNDKPGLKTAEAYFLDTALDKCKPGGIVGLIVPTGILDSSGNKALRERLLRKGEFLGAQRLPNTAFQHSHTEVTTDIVWFRKRDDAVAGALMTVHRDVLRQAGIYDDEFVSGRYFYGRGAGNVLGRLEQGWRAKAGMGADITVEGSMHGIPEAISAFVPEPSHAITMPQVLDAIGDDAKARERALGGAATRPYERQARPGDTKEVDGVRYILMGHPPRWHRVDEVESSPAVVQGTDIAAAIDRLFNGQGVDRADLESRLRAWVKDHGIPSQNEAILLLAGQDKRLYRLIGAVGKDGVLSDAVLGKLAPVERGSFETAMQSLALERERVSVAELSERTGMDADAVLDHLFASDRYALHPDGSWTTMDLYLTGNLWDQVDALDQALKSGSSVEDAVRAKYQAQRKALYDAIDPATLEDVEITLASAFVPTRIMSAFFTERNANSDNTYLRTLDPVEITFANGVYTITGGAHEMRLLDKYLNRTGIRKDDMPTIEAWNEEFKEWLCASRFREEVETLYNRRFKGFKERTYSTDPIDVPGLDANDVRDYKWAGLRWALNTGRGIIAHDVGLGKTNLALMLNKMLRVSGQAQKPIIVVPKSVLANWFTECERWFPGSRLLTIGGEFSRDKDGTIAGKDDSAAERKRKWHDLTQNNYDFVFVSEPAFQEVDLDPITKYELDSEDFWNQRGDSLDQSGDKRRKAIREAWAQERAGREIGKRTDAIYFNELGVDAVINDEMHHCFPSGTLVDGKPIDKLVPGDMVKSFNHATGVVEYKPVIAVAALPAKPMCRVTLATGQQIVSTCDHRFYTPQRGYIEAQSLNESCDVIISTTEDLSKAHESTLHRMQYGVRTIERSAQQYQAGESGFLQPQVFSPMARGQNDDQGKSGRDLRRVWDGVHDERQSTLAHGTRCYGDVLQQAMRLHLEGKTTRRSGLAKIARNAQETKRSAQGVQLAADTRIKSEEGGSVEFSHRLDKPKRASGARWQRSSDADSTGNLSDRFGVGNRIHSSDQREERQWLSEVLQDRYRQPAITDCDRGGWRESQQPRETTARHEKGGVLVRSRVVCVEIFKPGSDREFASLCPGGLVYDIEVADNHNFFAEGVLVHNCKGLFQAKPRWGDSPKFLGGQGKSDRALDFNLKARWLLRNHGNKGIFGLTATPSKNSPLEVYSMLYHIAPEAFENIGIRNSEEFLDRFCVFQNTKTFLSTSGEIKEATIVAGFKNLNELRPIMDRYIDRKTAEDVGLVIPSKDTREHLVEMDAAQEAEYVALREQVDPNSRDKNDAHIFAVMSDMNKAALDLELFDPKYAGHDSPKYAACAEQVKAGIADGGQVIFSEYVDAHERMKQALIAAGITANQIAVINAKVAGSASKRQSIAEAFNKGKLKVVIGNTATMGEGINLQSSGLKGTSDIHHLDLPWTPADMQQRNGRAVRQGNKQEAVRVHSYLAKRSFDGYRWQMLLGKKDWQDTLWHGGDLVENLAQEGAMSRDEMAILFSADPDAAREKFAANKSAMEEKYAAQRRAEDAEVFVRFRSMAKNYASLPNKNTKSAAMLKAKMDKLRLQLERSPYFKARQALLVAPDVPVLLHEASGMALHDGVGIRWQDGDRVVTGVDMRHGMVTLRSYGELNGQRQTVTLDQLSDIQPFAYSSADEGKLIESKMAQIGESRVASGQIKQIADLSGIPHDTLRRLYPHIQESLKAAEKSYQYGRSSGTRLALIDRQGNGFIDPNEYNHTVSDAHDIMLPLPEHKEAAIKAWGEMERSKKWETRTQYQTVRGRTNAVKHNIAHYPSHGSSYRPQMTNLWTAAGEHVFGEGFEREARQRFLREQLTRARHAKGFDETAHELLPTISQTYSGSTPTHTKRGLALLWAKAKHESLLDDDFSSHLSPEGQVAYPGAGPLRVVLPALAKQSGHTDLAAAMIVSDHGRSSEQKMVDLIGLAGKKAVGSAQYGAFTHYQYDPSVLDAMRHVIEKDQAIGDLPVNQFVNRSSRTSYGGAIDDVFGFQNRHMTVWEALSAGGHHAAA